MSRRQVVNGGEKVNKFSLSRLRIFQILYYLENSVDTDQLATLCPSNKKFTLIMNWASSLDFSTYHMRVTEQTFHISIFDCYCQNIAVIHINDQDCPTRLKINTAVLQGCVTILFVPV